MDGIYLTEALPKVTWMLSHVLLIIALYVEYPSCHHFTEAVTQRCCHLLKVTAPEEEGGKTVLWATSETLSQNPRPFATALSALLCLRWRPPLPPVLWSLPLCVSGKDLKGRAIAWPQLEPVFVCFPLCCSQCLFLGCEDWLDNSGGLDPPCPFENCKKVLLSTQLAMCPDEHRKASKLWYRASLLLSASLKGGAETSLGGQGSRKNNPAIENDISRHPPWISDQNKVTIFKSRNPFAFTEILKRIHLCFIHQN